MSKTMLLLALSIILLNSKSGNHRHHSCEVFREYRVLTTIETFGIASDKCLGHFARKLTHINHDMPFRNQGRMTDLLEAGKIEADLGLSKLDPANDRVMLCGSPAMLRDLKHMLEQRGFIEGNTTKPGDFVVERAFVEQ